MKKQDCSSKKKIAVLIIALLIVLLLAGAVLILLKDTTLISNNETTIEDNNITTISDNKLISDEQWDRSNDTILNLDEIVKPYLNSDGYVDAKDVGKILNNISDYLDKQKEKGIVSEYACGEHSATIIFDSGITYIYTPMVKRALGGTGDSKIVTLESADTLWDKIISGNKTLAAEIDALANENLGISGKLNVSDNAEFITNETRKFIYNDSSKIRNEDFTVEKLKSLDNYALLLLEGHGAWNDIEKASYLCTGEKATLGNRNKYEKELLTGEIAISNGALQSSSYAVSPMYLNKNLRTNENSFVFLGSCYSLKNDKLAKVFMDKGAYAVVGYDDEVDISYEKLTRSYFFRFATQKDENGNYPTVDNAVYRTQRLFKTYLDKSELKGEISILFDKSTDVQHTLFETLNCVSGTVKNKETKEAIGNVTVEVLDSNSDSFEAIATTTTDENGTFKLYLPKGNYSLSFNCDGYNFHGISLDVDSEIVVLTEPVLLEKKGGANLIATESDFENLTELFDNIGADEPFEYNANEKNAYRNIICGLLNPAIAFSPLCYYFYPNTPQESFYVMGTDENPNGSPDPLNRFTNAYIKIHSDEIDWIIKNIFSVTPKRDEADIDTENIQLYYYQNYYYFLDGCMGTIGSYSELEKTAINTDNSYTVTFNIYCYADNSLEGRYKTECALKMIDGKRQWTFTSIKKI